MITCGADNGEVVIVTVDERKLSVARTLNVEGLLGGVLGPEWHDFSLNVGEPLRPVRE